MNRAKEKVFNPLLMTTPEAANYLGVSIATMERWRFYGQGPIFRRIGPKLVRYRMQDLEQFQKEQSTTKDNK